MSGGARSEEPVGAGARVAAGAWVQIHGVVLAPAERATRLPDATRAVALEMTVKGFLARDAALGEEVEIETPAGRRLRGCLVAVDPPYEHRFGAPVPALATIGGELRALLAAARRAR